MAELQNRDALFLGGVPAAVGVGVKFVFVSGLSGVNNDTITIAGLTTVRGAFLISTTGVVGTMTFATNVITITNGGALTWSGLAWGTP